MKNVKSCKFNIPEKFPEAWDSKSISLSSGAYRALLVLSCVLNLFVAVISLSTLDLPNLICNLGMTAFLFAWAAIRIKTNKVTFKTAQKL